ADGPQEQRARADAATEHDELRIEDRAHRRDRGAQAGADMLDDRLGRGAPGTGELEHVVNRGELRVVGIATLVEGGDDPGGADLILEPSVQAVARVEGIADQ